MWNYYIELKKAWFCFIKSRSERVDATRRLRALERRVVTYDDVKKPSLPGQVTTRLIASFTCLFLDYLLPTSECIKAEFFLGLTWKRFWLFRLQTRVGLWDAQLTYINFSRRTQIQGRDSLHGGVSTSCAGSRQRRHANVMSQAYMATKKRLLLGF